jgi:hypothetical protein
MRLGMRALVAVALLGVGCRTAHDVGETVGHVATAPINLVRHKPSEPTNEVATTTTEQPPEAVTSSQPVATEPPPAPRPSPPHIATTETQSTPIPADEKPRPAPSPKVMPLDFPTAKPVEGKPGYVYSPFDPGKYVDVSGYTPGSKVKDPYSGKIFLVP